MLGWLVKLIVGLIGATLRIRVEDPHRVTSDNKPAGPVLFALWHNRIFLMPHLRKHFWTGPGHEKLTALVSASKDGEKLVRVLRHFKIEAARGSSSRRGKEALRELVRYVQEGYDAAVTPDGPRGPKYKVQHGVVSLAQLTGAPIIPVSYTVTRKITLNSWDAFIIPLPFARCTIRVGEPMRIPRDADDDARSVLRQELESRLLALGE